MSACCTPSPRPRTPAPLATPYPATPGTDHAPAVVLPGGRFPMGDEGPLSIPEDGETPVRTMSVAPFALEAHAVSNARFAAFAEATGHVTDAEHADASFVFGGLLPDDFPATHGVAAAPWWRLVDGATWRAPEGRHSDLADRADHPVVHVSARDAAAFADWAGGRLPTEAEWEYAARAGSTTTFPWGEDLEPDGEHRANVWQGEFPAHNTEADGWYSTCPVGAFPPSKWGTYNMIGNVWEWTSDTWAAGGPQVLKGGSYLCHASYCRRYRPGARSHATAESTMGNVGFRLARDVEGTG